MLGGRGNNAQQQQQNHTKTSTMTIYTDKNTQKRALHEFLHQIITLTLPTSTITISSFLAALSAELQEPQNQTTNPPEHCPSKNRRIILLNYTQIYRPRAQLFISRWYTPVRPHIFDPIGWNWDCWKHDPLNQFDYSSLWVFLCSS